MRNIEVTPPLTLRSKDIGYFEVAYQHPRLKDVTQKIINARPSLCAQICVREDLSYVYMRMMLVN